MQIIHSDNAPGLQGWKWWQDFSLAMVSAPIPFGTEGLSQITHKDMTYTLHTYPGNYSCWNLEVVNAIENSEVLFESLTPNVCTINQVGVVSRVSNGTCIVSATGQTGKRTRQFPINEFFLENTTKYESIDSYTAGSLRKYLYDQHIAALVGVTPGAAAQRAHINPNNYYTNGDVSHQGGSYGAVNPNNFLRVRTQAQIDAGFDGFNTALLDELLASVAFVDGIEWRAWISPHHYLCWKGHGVKGTSGPGWKVVGSETVVKYSAEAWTGALVKLLPDDYLNYLPKEGGDVPIAVQAGTGIACWTRMYNTYIGSSVDPLAERRWVMPVNLSTIQFKATDPRYPYQKQTTIGDLCRGGDSGSPVWLGIKGDLVLLCHTAVTGVVGQFLENTETSYCLQKAGINAAMNALSLEANEVNPPTYSVGVVDLGPTGHNFTSYA